MSATIPSVSKEYLKAPLIADVELDAQTVEVAFLLGTTTKPDGSTTWLPAEWTGPVGTTRSWRILIGPGTTAALAVGDYAVWSRTTANPEAPARKHGNLKVT